MLTRTDIVVFDFDGTLSASDSNWEFFKYCFKNLIIKNLNDYNYVKNKVKT